jgi:hypothetical protein
MGIIITAIILVLLVYYLPIISEAIYIKLKGK